MFIDQAKATGGANRPPPNDPLARSISHDVVWVDACFAKFFRPRRQQGHFFLSVSVPEDTSTSTITIWSERGLGRAG
jgi:hypothetical protein